jgi:hypothetical protein
MEEGDLAEKSGGNGESFAIPKDRRARGFRRERGFRRMRAGGGTGRQARQGRRAQWLGMSSTSPQKLPCMAAGVNSASPPALPPSLRCVASSSVLMARPPLMCTPSSSSLGTPLLASTGAVRGLVLEYDEAEARSFWVGLCRRRIGVATTRAMARHRIRAHCLHRRATGSAGRQGQAPGSGAVWRRCRWRADRPAPARTRTRTHDHDLHAFFAHQIVASRRTGPTKLWPLLGGGKYRGISEGVRRDCEVRYKCARRRTRRCGHPGQHQRNHRRSFASTEGSHSIAVYRRALVSAK